MYIVYVGIFNIFVSLSLYIDLFGLYFISIISNLRSVECAAQTVLLKTVLAKLPPNNKVV